MWCVVICVICVMSDGVVVMVIVGVIVFVDGVELLCVISGVFVIVDMVVGFGGVSGSVIGVC